MHAGQGCIDEIAVSCFTKSVCYISSFVHLGIFFFLNTTTHSYQRVSPTSPAGHTYVRLSIGNASKSFLTPRFFSESVPKVRVVGIQFSFQIIFVIYYIQPWAN